MRSWEELLGAYAGSTVPWVAQTAQAWLGHIHREMPAVSGTTVWGEYADANSIAALKARTAWIAQDLYGSIHDRDGLIVSTTVSAAGRSPVVKMALGILAKAPPSPE